MHVCNEAEPQTQGSCKEPYVAQGQGRYVAQRCRVPQLGHAGSRWVALGHTGSHWVALGHTGSHWVTQGQNTFHAVVLTSVWKHQKGMINE